MQELVFLKGKEPVTTSLIVAEGTDNEHRSIIRLIQNYQERFERWGKIRFTDLKSTNPLGGRPTTVALLNEQQATFLITLLRNNDVVLDFKSELVDRFYKMREILLNQRNAEWQEIRESTKRGNRAMCDVIHDYVIPLARANGSTTPDDKFYMTYQKAVNKAAGVQPKSRDTQPLSQLYEVEKIQDMVGVSIKGQVARGEHDHKQIYRGTNQLITDYSRISLIPERFLPA